MRCRRTRLLERVVAITFTEAAATQMGVRIGEALLAIEGEALPEGLLPEVLPGSLRERRLRARALRGWFESQGFEPSQPSILQPAEVFVDLSGEDIRRRLYTVTDPAGHELCLRPDFTIPVARAYLDSSAPSEKRYCYSGTAFRYRGGESVDEFEQADASLDEGVYGVLGVEKAVQAFVSHGSTAPSEVEKQVAHWKERLGLSTL